MPDAHPVSESELDNGSQQPAKQLPQSRSLALGGDAALRSAVDLHAEAERAATKHVVVIGGGVSGLVAALEVAKLGIRVTVLEASDVFGGAIRTAELAGVRIDTGAESYATRGGHVRVLLDELGLTDKIVTPNPVGAWLCGIPTSGKNPARGTATSSRGGGRTTAAPLPKGTILGIPANPFAPDVQTIIGAAGSWRAYIDRLMPVLKIGKETSLGMLVQKRMGHKVLDRLVAPITAGVYSADPMLIDVDLAAPGLNAAYTRTGSLSGGVAALQAASARKPGSAIEGIDGGMYSIVEALIARLRTFGVTLVLDTVVDALAPSGNQWSVCVVSGGDAPEDTTETDHSCEETTETDHSLRADAVIVATDERTARQLLAPHVAGLDEEAPAAPHVELVTLVIDDERLDSAPRGTGALTVPGSQTAKALTHSTVKWPWLAAQIEMPHRHVIRVSFGTAGEAPKTEHRSDEEAAELARIEASAMLGIPLGAESITASHRERFTQSQPSAEIGATEQRTAARDHINAVEGLAAVGAWQSGTGLAQVIPDAARQAERIRRHILFDPEVAEA